MNIKEDIKEILKNREKLLFDFSDDIWNFSEPGLLEYKSRDLYIEILEKEGFKIERNIGDIPTAFIGRWGKKGPTVAFISEYDALPGMSQVSDSTTKKIREEIKNTGHGCGHNLLGVASVGAAIAAKEYLEDNNIEGQIVLLGTPSEERDAGKTFMARSGAFDDIDIAFTWHPGDINKAWTAGSLANIIVNFNFKGVSSHAAATPFLGRSALDAAELMNSGVNYLREHIIPEARVHYAYTDVGGTAPNVVQSTSSLYYFIRAPKLTQAMEIYERVKKIAKGAALMTETDIDIDFQLALSDYIPNKILTSLLHESLVEFGVPEYDENDIKIARSFFKTLSLEDQKYHGDIMKKLYGEEEAQKILKLGINNKIQPLEEEGVLPGSTDVGDLSYIVPTAQMLITTSAIGTPLHSWQMTAQGKTNIAKKGLITAAGTMAIASIKAINNQDIIIKAKKELNRETGGKYESPIPEEVSIRDPKVKP